MAQYSPVKSLKIRNFRQLGRVDIEFDKPIITVVGENDAGKTSVMLALATVGLNANATKQKRYIKKGTDAFGVALDLLDGTHIERIKASNRNTLQIYKGQEMLLNLVKFDNPSLQPVELEKVMGLLKDSSTGEILNIRTYNDRLIFAQTTAGDNYKIIYEMLKVSNLVRALKHGNEEANELKRNISSNELLIEHTLGQIRAIHDVDIEPVVLMRNFLKQKYQTFIKAENAIVKKRIVDKYNTDTLSSVNSLNVVDVATVEKLKTAEDAKQRIHQIDSMNSIQLVNSTKVIDIMIISKLEKAVQEKKYITSDIISKVKAVSNAKTIDSSVVSRLIRARELSQSKNTPVEMTAKTINSEVADKVGSAYMKHKRIGELNISVSELQTEIQTNQDILKNSGAKFEICPNCGEVVLVNE